MDINAPGWDQLLGGYRIPYDPRKALLALERSEDVAKAWQELWNELYHQGDIGEASYAAVPQLVRIHASRGVPDWNTYALVATIEEARRDNRNPALPTKLKAAYDDAWHRLTEIGLDELRKAADPTLICSIIGVIAMAKNQFTLGRLAVSFTEDERCEMLEKADSP